MHKNTEKQFKEVKDKIINFITLAAGCSILVILFLIACSKWLIVQQILTMLGITQESLNIFLERLIYGCIALFAIVLGIERSTDTKKLRDNLESQSKAMDTLSEKIQIISSNYEAIISNLAALKNRFELINHITFPKVISDVIAHHVPQDLQTLFQKGLNDYNKYLSMAIVQKRINFDDAKLFNEIYRKWLEENPNATIYATSSPLAQYYWTKEDEKNTRIENTISDFIKNGGKMYRVFFVTKTDLDNPEIISRIAKQIKLGVNVYISEININKPKKDFFVIDQNKVLTLRIYTNLDMSMKEFSCSVDEDYHNRYLKEWKAILDMDTTYPYSG